jgi:hypothetical protein
MSQDIDHLLVPVLLEVALDGKVIGTVLACDYRDELLNAIGQRKCELHI